jgi:HTH-type transcriptional regulator / antitoxin HipB
VYASGGPPKLLPIGFCCRVLPNSCITRLPLIGFMFDLPPNGGRRESHACSVDEGLGSCHAWPPQGRMSQAELAQRAGVSRKWIYEFEAGKPTAEFGLLMRVLDELGLELELSARSKSPGSDRGLRIDLDALLEDHRGDD